MSLHPDYLQRPKLHVLHLAAFASRTGLTLGRHVDDVFPVQCLIHGGYLHALRIAGAIERHSVNADVDSLGNHSADHRKGGTDILMIVDGEAERHRSKQATAKVETSWWRRFRTVSSNRRSVTQAVCNQDHQSHSLIVSDSSQGRSA